MWILLLLPFVGLLWVPFYNFQEPALLGFPFCFSGSEPGAQISRGEIDSAGGLLPAGAGAGGF